MYYIGVELGASGGVAAIGDEVLTAQMPATERDVWDWFDNDDFKPYNTGEPAGVAIIEKVQGYIGSPTVGSSMFKFGMSYGGLRMALIAAKIPFEEITPQTWQKALSIPARKKTESKTDWKNRLKALAQQLFPRLKVTLATADALLLAEFCKRRHNDTMAKTR